MSTTLPSAQSPPYRSVTPTYDKLPRRYRVFIDNYLCGMSGADAIRAMRDVTRCSTAVMPKMAAYKYLKIPRIRRALDERRNEMFERMGVRQETVMRDMVAIATSDVRGLFDENGGMKPISEMPEELARAIASVDVDEIFERDGAGKKVLVGYTRKIKFWDKPRALEKLGQYLKLWEAAKVNVDARSITFNSNDAAGQAALRAVVELGERIAGAGAQDSIEGTVSVGPVLPAALRDEPQGLGAPVAAGQDPGSPEGT